MGILWCLLLTAAIEAFTCVMRFGAGLQATQDTWFLKSVTGGLRIHHAYLGAAAMLASWLAAHGEWRTWGLRIGIALVLSDLVHHFLVLWLVTGDPQFDLFYPD
jgi:hypothetical protein